MKWKPCCDKRCCVGNCEIREAGGCYCVCRLYDRLNHLNNVQNGRTIVSEFKGMVGCSTYPDLNNAKENYSKLSPEQKKFHDEYAKKAEERIKDIEKQIDSYRISY